MSKEEEILKLTADLWNKLIELEILHPSDMRENERDIHNIQNRVMARKYAKQSYLIKEFSIKGTDLAEELKKEMESSTMKYREYKED